ncbi:unnamed protein product [Didymodactylos carnosus]|uniref:Glutathione peroxidase n=1 Tax=Didymodactylos carnosus TaxID=1234261 RepID=A0A813S3P8_9BILA|nr:unnamed protein product [Didymodactylos carnosus]CAF0814826.1 unnamed protein product [Didymodactylos carnosus]CAF3573852.1 unnamed protein product [Didymodactylos carnosus]CAF3598809.1 unnamed protein product [Didymodactylos carnosus]
MGTTASQTTGAYKPSYGTFYDLKAKDIDGVEKSMADYKGKVLMVINVASACGKTDREYKYLTGLYDKFHSQGFEILAFPCNQFMYQESGTCTKIKTFIQKYNVQFPMFDKINVNGNETHPIYTWLKQSFPGRVTWNFSGKFLIDHNGIPRARSNDNFEEIDHLIQKLIDEKNQASTTG